MQKKQYLGRLVDKRSPVTTKEIKAPIISEGFQRNLFALIIVIAAVTGGLIVRVGFPDVPLADGDTWGYLHPALSWLSGLGFHQTCGRDWLYPALLAGILNIGGDFCAITFVQRFLGVAGIFIFWLAWRSWLGLLPAQRPLLRWVCFVPALALLALYALSTQQALLENTIRPEGVLAFFEMAYLYCLVSFFLARWKLRRTGPAIVFGTAAFTLSYVVWLLKPSWSLSLVFTVLCLGAGLFGRTTLRLGGFVAFAVLGATYGIVLAIAIGHSLEVSRYRISYAPGFLLGLAMLTNYLLIFALGTRNPDQQQSQTGEAIVTSGSQG
jgi:hypothetical protein